MRPYILLTIDSLREDCVSQDLLGQSLEILSRDYATFSNAISYGVATPFAFPGILAGVHPAGDGLVPETATTLAEGIPSATVGYSNNGHLREERGYTRGFETFVENPTVDTGESASVRSRVLDQVKQIDYVRHSQFARELYNRFLQGTYPSPAFSGEQMRELVKNELHGSPDGLFWAHWMDPHTPYHPETAIGAPENLPDLEHLKNINDKTTRGDASALTTSEIELSRSLYDANVRYFDEHFSDLLNWLSEQSWYDEAVIIIVSDHGEYFGEHGQLFHAWDIDPYDEAVRTPLWVKYPGQDDAGSTFNHLVGHGDIVATLFNLFDEVEPSPPNHTAPLRKESGRHIVSVSNTAKRLTEPDGVCYQRRDGTTTKTGTISERGKEFLSQIELPEIVNSKGNAQGVEEAERKRRLQQLGYR